MPSQIHFRNARIVINADMFIVSNIAEILADPETEALDKAATVGALSILLDSSLAEFALTKIVARKAGD